MELTQVHQFTNNYLVKFRRGKVFFTKDVIRLLVIV